MSDAWRDRCDGGAPHRPRLVWAFDGEKPLDRFMVCETCGRCFTEEWAHRGAWFWQTTGPYFREGSNWVPLRMTLREGAWARLRAAPGVYL